MIDVIKLLSIFVLMVVVLKFSKQLVLAVASAALATALLFQLGVTNSLVIAGKSIISPMTYTTVLAFYTITFLQRMLEKRKRLLHAQECLNGIFNNRRVNASLAPIMVGMLPSAMVVTIAGAMVDDAAQDSLNVEEKAFVATYFRHVSEAFLPTYTSIIIGTQLAGVELPMFLLGMLPVLVFIILMGFVVYLRKIPKETGTPPSGNRLKSTLRLFGNVWTLLIVVVIVILFKLPVYQIVTGVVIVNLFVDRFKWAELKPLFRSAFEPKLIISAILIMVFKDLLIDSGVIAELPATFSQLPLPSFIVYGMIIFFGAVVAGQQAINVVALPMAFAAGTGAGVPLFVLLMTCGYCAMQISPTHICLPIICDYFKVSMGALVRKTLPVILSVMVFAALYYLLLTQFIS
jgi:integral membrane protein (TIGR00529 family)